MLLVTGLLQADSGQTTDLGTAEPVFQQLSYGLDEARKLAVPPLWRLSAAGVADSQGRRHRLGRGQGLPLSGPWCGEVVVESEDHGGGAVAQLQLGE